MKICFECRKKFNPEELVQIENVLVCGNCKPAIVQRIEEFGFIIAPLKPAGFLVRLLAIIIDCVFLYVSFHVLSRILILLILKSAPFVFIIFILLSLLPLLFFLYFVHFVGDSGATLGKKLLKIKVIQMDKKKVGYGLAIFRFFACILSVIVFGIGFIMVIFDKKYSLSLHDRICKTRVVYVNSKKRPLARRK